MRSKENNEGEEEETATLKLITDAVVSTLGHLLTEVRQEVTLNLNDTLKRQEVVNLCSGN